MGLSPTHSLVETPSRAFYREAMEALSRAGVPFLVGGAFAFVHQAGIDRSTKDLDIFVRPSDVHLLLGVTAAAGYEADLVYSHWLAKIKSPTGFIDVIFSSGNGIAVVDDAWFEHATEREVLGVIVKVAPAEESIWSKSFVMERERYDGADVAHIILAHGERLDWRRLIDRFGPSWRVLLSSPCAVRVHLSQRALPDPRLGAGGADPAAQQRGGGTGRGGAGLLWHPAVMVAVSRRRPGWKLPGRPDPPLWKPDRGGGRAVDIGREEVSVALNSPVTAHIFHSCGSPPGPSTA